MNIYVEYINGLQGDRVEVQILNENNKIIREETFSYGYNASSCRRYAKYAEKDYNDSIKYNWTTRRCLKPYIGDLLVKLFEEYGMTKEEVNYSGYYVFPQRPVTKEEIAQIVEKLYAEL